MSASSAAISLGRGRIALAVALGQPHRADRHADRRDDARAVGDDELGRAAADIDDDVRRARELGERARDREERELGLARAADDLDRRARGSVSAGPTNSAAFFASRIACVAITAGAPTPCSSITARYSRQISRLFATASGSSRPLASRPLPSRPNRQRSTTRSEFAHPRSGAAACSCRCR